MKIKSSEGAADLKRPHETASPDSATPTKKTFSDAPATRASESSAIQTERTLLPPRVIRNGVDMGRSFSVLLFCIAMDPILHYLNRIPDVMIVQGYVDDTTLAGTMHNASSWITKTFDTCRSLKTAGIQVDPHRCWKASLIKSNPIKVSAFTETCPFSWIQKGKLATVFSDV